MAVNPTAKSGGPRRTTAFRQQSSAAAAGRRHRPAFDAVHPPVAATGHPPPVDGKVRRSLPMDGSVWRSTPVISGPQSVQNYVVSRIIWAQFSRKLRLIYALPKLRVNFEPYAGYLAKVWCLKMKVNNISFLILIMTFMIIQGQIQ